MAGLSGTQLRRTGGDDPKATAGTRIPGLSAGLTQDWRTTVVPQWERTRSVVLPKSILRTGA